MDPPKSLGKRSGARLHDNLAKISSLQRERVPEEGGASRLDTGVTEELIERDREVVGLSVAPAKRSFVKTRAG